MKLRNRWEVMVGVGGMLALAGITCGGFSRAAAPPAGPTAGKAFKNIQVLKNLPADQLMPVMQMYNASLGVRCSFCHVAENFASDAKPEKRTTRQMILLTDDINKREPALHKMATCYMCHHATGMPQTKPPAPSGT